MTDIVERLRDFTTWEYRGGLEPRASHPRICGEAADKIEQLHAVLQQIATAEPAAAGSTKPMPFKEWARLIASTALSSGKREP